VKRLTFLLLSVSALLATVPALAGQATLTWTAPTQCVDGTPISNCPLTGYTIHYGTIPGADVTACTAAIATTVKNFNFPASTSTPVLGLTPGNYCFAMKAVSASGSSVLSNFVLKTVVNPLPNPPVLSTVETTAMSVKADWERLAFVPSLPVGSIALGTPCDASKSLGGGYYAVDRTLVQWSGANRPANVVAKCEALEL
jgi:hypothetical protein